MAAETEYSENNREANKHLSVSVNCARLPNNDSPVYLSVTLDCFLTYKNHLESLRLKVNIRNGFLRCLVGSSCGAYTWTLCTGALALVYSTAEYATPVWCRSCHTKKLDCAINNTICVITGCLRLTETIFLPVLSGIMPPKIRREHCIAKLVIAAKENPHHLLHQQVSIAAGILSPQRLKSRRPFIH